MTSASVYGVHPNLLCYCSNQQLRPTVYANDCSAVAKSALAACSELQTVRLLAIVVGTHVGTPHRVTSNMSKPDILPCGLHAQAETLLCK